MKKLIAISVVFALIAGAAFADTWMGGGFRAKWTLISNSGEEDADTTTNIGIDDTSFTIGGSTEDGVMGGQMRIRGWHASAFSDWEYSNFGGSHFFAWWKPIPQVQFYLGQNPDGWFGYDGFVGWGFHEGANDYTAIHGYDYGDGHVGGYNKLGFALAIRPIDGLEINFGLPLGHFDYDWVEGKGELNTGHTYEDVFKTIYVGAQYGISGIGTIFFNFTSLGYAEDWKSGDIGFGFHLSALDGIPIILLAKIGLMDDSDLNPFGLSIGAAYYAGDFGVRFRAATTFVKDADFNLKLNVMPFYDLGILKAFLSIGFHLNNEDSSLFYINPYVMKWIGAGTLSAGIQVNMQNDDGETTTSFNLPLVIGFSF